MTQTPQLSADSAASRTSAGGRNRRDGRRPRDAPAGGRGAGAATGARGDGQGKSRVTFPWINGQIISAAETENLGHLLLTINAHLPQMNLVNLSTALHRVAKLIGGGRGSPCYAQAMQSTVPALLSAVRQALLRSEANGSQPKCQALSNITWALATMQVVDVPLLQMVATRAHCQLADFKNFELCQLLWAFAKLGTVDSTLNECNVPLFASAAEFVIRHVGHFSFRGLVMTAWAFATAKQHDRRLFGAVAQQLVPHMDGANCQELANTAWSFSTAGVHQEHLFASLAQVATPRVHEFKPQELSSILWSFASIGYQPDAFYDAAGRAAMGLQLQAQQLANILWALTKMRPRHEATQVVLLTLLPRCTRLIGTFKPQELASVALAAGKCFGAGTAGEQEPTLAVLPPQAVQFFHAVIPLAVPNLQEYSGQSLANLASSFLAVRIGADEGLFPAVGYEIMSRVESLENSALLLLLRTLPQAPRSVAVSSALCLLFAEAARRVDGLPSRELQVLSRTCVRPLGVAEAGVRDGSWESREELRLWCLALASRWQDGDLSRGYAGVKQTAPHPAQAGAADDAGAAADRWANPMTLMVAPNKGRPASAWDEEATQQLREAVESSVARREEAAGDDGLVDGPTAWVAGSPSGDKAAAQQPHIVFSVKNTFLEVEDDAGDFGAEVEPDLPLAPALPFIPDSVSAEKLQAYRANYARFRVGNAIGAKGELDTVS